LDPRVPTVAYPVEKIVDIIEHLCDHKSSSSVDFLLQVFDISVNVWSLRVAFWVTGNADVKIIGIILTNVLNEVNCVRKQRVARVRWSLLTRFIAS
jgi:hypothetical protein